MHTAFLTAGGPGTAPAGPLFPGFSIQEVKG